MTETCYACGGPIGYTEPRVFDMPGGLRHIHCPRLKPSINAPSYMPEGCTNENQYVRPMLEGDWDEDFREPKGYGIYDRGTSLSEGKVEDVKTKNCPLCHGTARIHEASYPVLFHPSHYHYASLVVEDKDVAVMLRDAYRFLKDVWMGVP